MYSPAEMMTVIFNCNVTYNSVRIFYLKSLCATTLPFEIFYKAKQNIAVVNL